MTPIDLVSWYMIAALLDALIVRVLMWCDCEHAPSSLDTLEAGRKGAA